MQNKTSVWAAGAAVVVIAIFAAAYFLLIGPVMDSTAETDDQRTQVEAQNQTLRSQNATLRGQFENIEQLRVHLAALQVQVPDAAEWDTFTTLVGSIANDNGVTVASITGQPAVSVAGTAAATVPSDDAAATSDDAATPVAATGQAIPVTIKFQGSSAAVIGTINSLQGVDQRLFLVQAVDLQGMKASESSTPPVAPGSASVEVSGYILVQPPVAPVPNQTPPLPWNNNAPALSPA